MKENEREAQIQRALKALESGKYTTLSEAAIAFNVPKSTNPWSSKNGPSDSAQSTRKRAITLRRYWGSHCKVYSEAR